MNATHRHRESRRMQRGGARAEPTSKRVQRRQLRAGGRSRAILVVDVGGNRVKLLATGQREPRAFASGKKLTPARMVAGVNEIASDWKYDVVSLGYPGVVVRNRPLAEPHNLGRGWVGFDYAAAFGRPTLIVNDAAMQALGSYRGGRMLFLGLGTGLGTALIVDGAVEPMEIAHLPYRKATYEDYVGARALKRLGRKKWHAYVVDIVERLESVLEPDDIVLGGGNAQRLGELPPACRLGDNANAFVGGFRLWEDAARRRDVDIVPPRARRQRSR